MSRTLLTLSGQRRVGGWLLAAELAVHVCCRALIRSLHASADTTRARTSAGLQVYARSLCQRHKGR
jgi:hypothetical protein